MAEKKSIFSMFPNYVSPLGDWETVEKKEEKQDDNKIYFIVAQQIGELINGKCNLKITITLSGFTNQYVKVLIGDNIFSAYSKTDDINKMNVYYVDTLIDIGLFITKEIPITVQLINNANKITDTKTINFIVGKESEVKKEIKNDLISLNDFINIFGNRKLFSHKNMREYLDVYDLDKQIFVNKLNEFLTPFQINTPIRIAHFFGQIEHEAAHLSTTQEFHDGSNYEGRIDLGNTQKGDGKRFRGRGLIQLTGRANYSAYTSFYNNLNPIKIDFTIEPNNLLFVSNIDYAINVSCWYWQNKGLSLFADEDDLIYITYLINGGFTGYNDRKGKTLNTIKTMRIQQTDELLKDLGVYNVKNSRLYNDFDGMYVWAKYFDEKYPKLEGTGKNEIESKNAYQRVINIFENNLIRKTSSRKTRYENAKSRFNNIR